MWSNFIQYCMDPWLVARIQEFFGVEIHYQDDSKRKAIESEIEISSANEINGLNDIKPNSAINGCVTEDSEDTTKKRYKETLQSNSEDASITSLNKNTKPFTIKNLFWYYLFLFGTELGDETFYRIFIPFWLWNVDGVTGRRIILVWSIVMAVGQILKDIICWPRPACPPAVRLQKKWSLEYGMPSTHAMIAVCIPFSVVLFTRDRFIYSFSTVFILAIVWCTLICISRLYLGMHTVLDVIAGLVLASAMMIFLVPLVDMIDDYFVTSSWGILALIIISLAVIIYYPSSDKWTPTRNDTAMVVATCAGVHFGYWINYKTGLLTTSLIPPPYKIIWPTYQLIGITILRTIMSFSYILFIKPILENLVSAVMCAILKENPKELKKSKNSLENKNKILVVVVSTYITCFVITGSMISLLAKILDMIGIGRPTFYTEL